MLIPNGLLTALPLTDRSHASVSYRRLPLELRLGLFHFGLKFGHGPHRVEFEVNRHQVWYRLPLIGQGQWWRGQGWVVDRWPEVKNEGSAF